MAPPASSCPKKEEQKTDAPWSAGKGLGWEWGGWGPRGPASGWAGALLLFNHSPVTCSERETKAACPHPQYPRKGSRVALWGGLRSPLRDARLGSWRIWGSAEPSRVTSIKSYHLGFLLPRLVSGLAQGGASLRGWRLVAGRMS